MRSAFVVGIVCVFLLVNVFVYWGIWNNEYYKDDFLWLSIGRQIARSPSALFTPDPVNTEAVVRVTQRLSFALTWLASGTNPSGYHAVSLLLHTLVTALVFFVLRELLARRADPERAAPIRLAFAFFGAFLFATSYNHASAVVWASSQSTLIVTSVVVGLFLFVLRNETRLHERRVVFVIVAGYVVALASKNTAVAFPLVLAAHFLLARRGSARTGLRLAGGLALLGIAQVVFTKSYLGGVDLRDAVAGADGRYALSTNVPGNVLGTFLATFMPPSTYELVLAWLPYPIAAVAGIAFVGAGARWLPDGREIWLGLIWILVMALPVSLFDYRQFDGVHVMVSRYVYTPLVGWAILVTFVAFGFLEKRRSTRACVLLVLLALSVAAVNVALVQGKVRGGKTYGDRRREMIDYTAAAARNRLPRGAVIYAVGWPIEEHYIARISQLYFEDLGFTLEGPSAFERLKRERPQDGVPRYMAGVRAGTRRFEVIPVPAGL